MVEPRRHAAGWGLLGVALGAIATVIGASLYVTARIARTVVTPPRRQNYDIDVLGRDNAKGTITLSITGDTTLPGRYGLFFEGDRGYLRLGDVVRQGKTSVTRRVETVAFAGSRASARARWSGAYFLAPEELGFPVQSVQIPGALGAAPAWLIRSPIEDNATETDAAPSRWVIVVHGRGARRQEGLRAVPVFRQNGYSSLLISYRNDGDAPDSPDARYGLGGTEWRDVEAAIEFAVHHGARSIVLMGFSMGGAIVLQTVTRSVHKDLVRAVVLDSPVIDWVNTLEYQAELLRVPPVMAEGAMRILGSSWGNALTGQSEAIDLASMDFVNRAADLALPILIMHSDDDGYVPSTGSRELALERPDIVTLVSFSHARHTRLWNYDPERWNGAITGWLGELPA